MIGNVELIGIVNQRVVYYHNVGTEHNVLTVVLSKVINYALMDYGEYAMNQRFVMSTQVITVLKMDNGYLVKVIMLIAVCA